MKIMSYKSLIAYQKSFSLAMKIFKISKRFPKEEMFGLTDQMRRSSRSVCSNMAEGYRKRRYEAHFISKLTDADMENTETQVWLDFALACEYIIPEEYNELYADSEEVGKLLNHMIENPTKFLPASKKNLT
jgi:four helix bundle protein